MLKFYIKLLNFIFSLMVFDIWDLIKAKPKPQHLKFGNGCYCFAALEERCCEILGKGACFFESCDACSLENSFKGKNRWLWSFFFSGETTVKLKQGRPLLNTHAALTGANSVVHGIMCAPEAILGAESISLPCWIACRKLWIWGCWRV